MMQKAIGFWNSGLRGKLTIGCGTLLISCCCLLVGLAIVTPNSASIPTAVFTPRVGIIESSTTPNATSTFTVTVTPFPSPTISPTPDPIEDIRTRFKNPDLRLYEEYSSIDVLLDGEILKISIARSQGDSWGYESLQDISEFLHLALVDCTEYRFGHGIGGCKIKKTAPYKYVELREYIPSGELKAYVRFTVGNKEYFAGYDGTQIIANNVFETADESFLQP